MDNPEDAKRAIAAKQVKNSYKDNLCDAYSDYARCHGMTWKRPHYKKEERLPRIPTTEAIQKIIARASWKCATIFSARGLIMSL